MQPPIPLDEVDRPSPTRLPVASAETLRAQSRILLRRHRAALSILVALQSVAAVAALAGPLVLSRVVEQVTNSTATLSAINTGAALFLGALLAQTAFTGLARMRGALLGESVLADLREDFVSRAVELPPSTIETAGTGDLVTRTTTDVDRLNWAVRHAVPEIIISLVSVALVLVALLVTAPQLAAAWLLAIPPIVIATRWYFKRAPRAYRAEMNSYSGVNSTIAETVDAGRTIEAYGLGGRRVERTDDDIRTWVSWERYTLSLRTVFFPSLEAAYVLPLAAVLALGGYLYAADVISLAQMTAGVLYTQMLIEPVDLLLMWFDELQTGQASLSRLLGVHEVPLPDSDPDLEPVGRDLTIEHVAFGYREGRDVLRGIDLVVPAGQRLAVVGPSGAGKSTLGRLIAGVHAPRVGRIEIGGASLARMPTERVRQHVALVTQEHHVFVGSLRDNLRLAWADATDDDLWSALDAVDASEWARALPDGLDTTLGAGGSTKASPSQAQQIALARLVLADPHTLVLDEATSLLDPRAARHLESSLAAVLEGRTVVAIAHRLHTAHDADRIVVVEDGRITEAGSHDELVAARGAYAALWDSWRDEG
ncbi:MAG: ATP-binding cassette domain-containing protein [Actinobacteria bacterium]|uniref:Unannotated protein n=1 Tax=freshwater metagenome TaxID=449393 RepID=A0A6J7NQM3_9ZZZZ|nr:ATP-binding cassette domain-containing protein [Actinomycetota bacterium]